MVLRLNWLNLPELALFLIANKLIYIKDYVRFGAVCHLWRSVYTENKHRLPPQLPMLMLPTELNTDQTTRSFYNIIEKNISNFQVPVPQSLYCRGSSHGWLATVSRTFRVSLFNPLLSADNEIELPSLTNFVHRDIYDISCGDFLVKVVLSDNPTRNTNFVVMAIYGSLTRLAYWMPGDKDWRLLPSKVFVDVIYYKDKFYGLNISGEVSAWDLKHGGRRPRVSNISPPLESTCRSRYLVECAGKLFQVLRHVYDDLPLFDVFKLDVVGWKWIKVANIDGHALFLGNNSSLSVSASEFPGCKPNSIYYTDDDYILAETDSDLIFPRVFSLEDGMVEYLHPAEKKNYVTVPIWFTPTL